MNLVSVAPTLVNIDPYVEQIKVQKTENAKAMSAPTSSSGVH
jgi:hypothetical protein